MAFDPIRLRDVARRTRKSLLGHVFVIQLTGEEAEFIEQAVRLNRRMLDRGVEHELLDRAFTLIHGKLNDSWRATPAAQELEREHKEALGVEG